MWQVHVGATVIKSAFMSAVMFLWILHAYRCNKWNQEEIDFYVSVLTGGPVSPRAPAGPAIPAGP